MRDALLKTLLIFILFFTGTGIAAEEPSEYKVKAAYLYNFAKFIKWSEGTFHDKSAPLIIGVLGENAFSGKLKPLNSRLVRNRPIRIKYFKTVKEVKNCQLLYIDISEPEELEAILNKLKSRPIITIGETKKFASSGGVIQFVTIRGRLRFIINLDVAKKNKIQMDSQLLSLAIDVLEVKNEEFLP